MKKVMLSLALMAFVGATTISYAVADNGIAIEKKDDEKKKKKNKKGCADKQACEEKEGAKGCCSKGGEAKTCTKKTTTEE